MLGVPASAQVGTGSWGNESPLRCRRGEPRGGQGKERQVRHLPPPPTSAGSQLIHAIPKFPCLNSSIFAALEVLQSPFNAKVTCGQGATRAKRLYHPGCVEATRPGNKRTKCRYIERTKLTVLFCWCPTWHKQIQGAASFCCAGEAGNEGGDLPPLPQAFLAPPATQSGGTTYKNYLGIFFIAASVLLSHFHRVCAVSLLFLGVCSI